jgi:arginine-tRNA-protein transferase
MESDFRFLSPPSRCSYLPDRLQRLEYEHVAALTAAEYRERIVQGWRRFGRLLFRPRCTACTACRSLRVLVERFRPDRSQRRARKANEGVVRLAIGPPSVTRVKLDLFNRYHAFQAEAKGWPDRTEERAAAYHESFVDNPFPTEEWRYTLDGRLIGVGYVDTLPDGLSAIYFYYDPDERHRSLGTWNILCLIDAAATRRLPYVYLGYYVADCPSLAYKARFVPNEVRGPDGRWQLLRA